MNNKNVTFQPKINIFKLLEKYIGEKFPDNLDGILILCGFDGKGCLLKIDFDSVGLIEDYINSTRQKFDAILKGTKYEHETPFKFLPGHSALIRSLPEFLLAIDSEKEKQKIEKKTRKRVPALCDITASTTATTTDESTHTISQEESEKIKQLMIYKINSYCAERNIEFKLLERYILKFKGKILVRIEMSVL